MIPTFDKKEAYWWLIKVDQYFEAIGMPEEMKLSWAAAMALRGDALKWWFYRKESNQNVTWWTFEKVSHKRFQPEFDPDIPVWVQNKSQGPVR